MLSNPTHLSWHKTIQDGHTILAHKSLSEPVTHDWFDAAFWEKQNAITGESKGRNTTYFIKYLGNNTEPKQTRHFVLRHYYRGGLVSKVLNDEFLYTGIENTRSIAEFTMLQKMVELDLPVPNPIAAMVTKVSGLWCRNDILIERIDDAKDGFYWLISQNLTDQTWQNIGATIKQFHQNGVYHSDLNIHNIMIDKNGKVFLIDFDRCEFKAPSHTWQQANLARLLRSLEKEKNKEQTFHFTDRHWQQLLLGYGQ